MRLSTHSREFLSGDQGSFPGYHRRNAIKRFAFQSVNKFVKVYPPTFRYNIEPIQLARLVMEIERLKNVEGNIVEVGVSRGMTTKFLAEHIKMQKLDNTLTYFAIDTFESFIKSDLDYEVEKRGKSLSELRAFEFINYATYAQNFAEYPFIKTIKADCAIFDYEKISPLKLSFLDVDIYLPTKKALPKLYDATIDGGVIFVDDVLNDMIYDGAYQAFMEFCSERGLEPIILGNKCGVIHKAPPA